MSWQLTALTGLRALCHLDLQVVGVHQVLARDTKTARRDLLNRRTLRVAACGRDQALRILTAFTSVALAANSVHCNSKRFVNFSRNGAITHSARRKSLNDVLHRFHFGNIDWLSICIELEQTPQGRKDTRLVIDRFGVLLKHVVPTRTRGVLQLVNSLGIEEMMFTFATPLIFTTDF